MPDEADATPLRSPVQETAEATHPTLDRITAAYSAEQAPATEVLEKHLDNKKGWRNTKFEALLDEAALAMSQRDALRWIEAHPGSTPDELGKKLGIIAGMFSLGLEYGAVNPSAYPNWQAVEKTVLDDTAARRAGDPAVATRVTERLPDILEAYGFARLLTGGLDQAREAFAECAKRRKVTPAEVIRPLAPLLAKVSELAIEDGPLNHFYREPSLQRALASLISSGEPSPSPSI